LPVKNQIKEVKGRYTKDIVRRMCTDAIEQSLKDNKSKTTLLAGDNSYAVKPFDKGPNICITVNKDSCFPKSIEPTTKQPGEKC